MCVRGTDASIEIHRFRANRTTFPMTENGRAGKADTRVSQAPIQLLKDLICLEDDVPTWRDLSSGKVVSGLRAQAGSKKRNGWRPCDNK